MTDSSRPQLTNDVVSDVVCPWCYVGKKRLEDALAQFNDADVQVNWRPFQLDPTIPQGGIDRREYLEKKFGKDRVSTIHERIESLGREAGIPFAFDRIEKSPNTLDAHRLIRWAFGSGAQQAIVDRLFRAYFVEGKDIGDRDFLADLAAECGLDREAVRLRLDTDLEASDVQSEIASAVRMGVNGVPFFIIDGKFGLSGAQPSEVIVDAMRQALAKNREA